jgi:hypothetical protein
MGARVRVDALILFACLSCVSDRGECDRDSEFAGARQVGVDLQAEQTAVGRDEREAEAEMLALGAGGVSSPKRFEDLIEVFRRKPIGGVHNANRPRIGFASDVAAGWRVRDGVREQAVQHGGEQGAVGLADNSRGELELRVNALLGGERRVRVPSARR